MSNASTSPNDAANPTGGSGRPSVNVWLLVAGLTLTVLLVIVLASGFGRDMHQVKSPLVGRVAPPFALDRVDGRGTVSFDSLRGQPALVNFWATWCEPCQAEHHVLQAGADRFGSQVQFVGIVYEDEPDRIKNFLSKNGGSYPTLIDRGGKAAISYGVYGVPETFFIDAKGRIIRKYEGPLSVSDLAGFIGELLDSK